MPKQLTEARVRAMFIAMSKAKVLKLPKIKRKVKAKSTRKKLMTVGQKKALIKAIGKNKSMKPASRKAAIRKIRAKKTRK